MSLKAIWAHNTPYSRFLLAVGIILISAIFFTLLGMVVAASMYHIPLASFETALNNPSDPNGLAALKFIQVVSSIGTFFVPAFVLAWAFDSHPRQYLGLTRKAGIISILLVALTIIAALPLINLMGEWNSHMSLPKGLAGVERWFKEMEENAAKIQEEFLNSTKTADLWFNLFMIGLLPAIGEELLFRGIIQKLFRELASNVHVAVWATAILFSAIHLQFYGFLPRMVLGLFLGYLAVWSGSLWLSMCAHFVNNASILLLDWFYRTHRIGTDINTLGLGDTSGWVPVSVVLTAILIFLVHRIEQRKVAPAAA